MAEWNLPSYRAIYTTIYTTIIILFILGPGRSLDDGALAPKRYMSNRAMSRESTQ